MANVTIDDSLIIQAAKENPDARPTLKALFPTVFTPKVPQVGWNYVRGNRIYVVTSYISPVTGVEMFFLCDVKNGLIFTNPSPDPTQIFGSNAADFKKCAISVTYTEL